MLACLLFSFPQALGIPPNLFRTERSFHNSCLVSCDLNTCMHQEEKGYAITCRWMHREGTLGGVGALERALGERGIVWESEVV